MFLKILGFILLSLPFVGIFIYVSLKDSVLVAAALFALFLNLILVIVVGIKLAFGS